MNIDHIVESEYSIRLSWLTREGLDLILSEIVENKDEYTKKWLSIGSLIERFCIGLSYENNDSGALWNATTPYKDSINIVRQTDEEPKVAAAKAIIDKYLSGNAFSLSANMAMRCIKRKMDFQFDDEKTLHALLVNALNEGDEKKSGNVVLRNKFLLDDMY